MLLISLRLTVNAGLSFRGCPKALHVFFSSIPSLTKVKLPSRTTVQRWAAKVGYYKLHLNLEKANDWIILIDESIQVGSDKYLTILGCREKDLPLGRSLNLEDLTPLHAIVQTKSDADSILKSLKAVQLRVGKIKGVCSDECSNLVNAIKLYQKEDPNVIHIPDIVHKLANIIKKQLKDDLDWEQFIKSVNNAKLKMYNSSMAYLAPPALRGKSRFLNLDVLVEWASNVMKILKAGIPSSDYDPSEAEKYLGWLRQFEEPLNYYTSLLRLVSTARNLVREKGIYRSIADDFAIEFENISPEEGWDVASSRVANQVYEFLKEQGGKVELDRIMLGSSEVIETFFGKYKTMQGNQTKAGFSGLVLAGLAHVGKIDKATVQASIETVTHKQVDDWVKKMLVLRCTLNAAEFLEKPKYSLRLYFKKFQTIWDRN